MFPGPHKLMTLHRVGCVTLMFACALAVAAQSGRRARKSTPEPLPTPAESPTPQPTVDKPKPALTFIVGLDKYGDFSRVSLNVYSGVLENVSDRLADAPSVRATTANNSMSRSDAIAKAKAEPEAYLVWLRLRPNNFSGQTGPYDNPDNVYIEYWVFAPGSAKVVTSGNTYPDAYRNKRIRLPTPTSSGDYYLNQAARGAAERILDHFHKRGPVVLP
jgi:hypothetical protein